MRLHAAALLVLVSAFVAHAAPSPDAGVGTRPQQTTRDKIYTKAQATHGAELYVKLCERCHDPAKVLPGKKPGPPLIGPKFLDKWQDHTLGDLFTSILTTMPNDGSAVLTPEDTLDLVTCLLSANGFPEGQTPLKIDDAMKATVITKGQRAGGKRQR